MRFVRQAPEWALASTLEGERGRKGRGRRERRGEEL
jgi:hypothetical protein